MHVVADGAQVAVAAAIDQEGLVTSAKEVAKEFVAAVEAAGVGAQEPFHARDQIGPGRLDHQMKMIFHEAIGMHLPGSFGAGLREGFEETPAVEVVLEDGFAAVAAAHDVVNGAGVLDAKFAGHAGRLRASAESVNRKTRCQKICGPGTP